MFPEGLLNNWPERGCSEWKPDEVTALMKSVQCSSDALPALLLVVGPPPLCVALFPVCQCPRSTHTAPPGDPAGSLSPEFPHVPLRPHVPVPHVPVARVTGLD